MVAGSSNLVAEQNASLGHLVKKTGHPKLLNFCVYVAYDKIFSFSIIDDCRLVKIQNPLTHSKSLFPALSGYLANLPESVKGGAQTALEKNVRILSRA